MDITEHPVVNNLKHIYEGGCEAQYPQAAAVFLLMDWHLVHDAVTQVEAELFTVVNLDARSTGLRMLRELVKCAVLGTLRTVVF